ncbi:MerR family transcriptional regulator [Maritalea porphyrae]|uniref:HTH-type transcriptional regulator SkgA n=1 Tax=Maritalea porphyrae TaxID=880732 RepID=A0ABQ5UQT9_9HYPH|nr:MerR family transcriptional regulator [Maritalea porphyrae]GLQ17140.1 HTH-type transcriptional regulator SkgA [Maritalea porphyrae]
MKTYQVKQVAQMAGISVRALHHYDQIGLLCPAFVGDNGYRYYTRDELVRLQEILFFKEMGIGLNEIAQILEEPDHERAKMLEQQKSRLEQDQRRQLQLIKTIERSIDELNGVRKMNVSDLYKGFSKEKQAAYEQELIDKLGPDMAKEIEDAKQKLKQDGLDGENQLIAQRMAELADIEGEVVLALQGGIAADDAELDNVIARHHNWVGQWWKKQPDQAAYIGLSQMYQSHEDFVARYEALAPGLTEYLAAAMVAYAKRHLG